MVVIMSPYLEYVQPALRSTLTEVGRQAHRLDRDINTDELLITIRRHTKNTTFTGCATPTTVSMYCNRQYHHPPGKVHLTLGEDVGLIAIVRVTAHEFRHIGQFQRGRKVFGNLCTALPEDEVEPDAFAFEDKVLDRMGVAHAW